MRHGTDLVAQLMSRANYLSRQVLLTHAMGEEQGLLNLKYLPIMKSEESAWALGVPSPAILQ